MSQVVKRKSAAGDEKEKRQTDSPVKDMKKKLAANADKEKMAADKTDKVPDKKEKVLDKKIAETKSQTPEKKDKPEKPQEKKDKEDKKEKEDKKQEPVKEREDPKPEKSNAKDNKPDKSKPEQVAANGNSKPESNSKQNGSSKQNGNAKVHNGVSDVTLSANGTGDDLLHEVASSDSDNGPSCEPAEDELFPELAYEEDEEFDLLADGSSRSATRRSQVKSARTPETPRPLSGKPGDESKEAKILKMAPDSGRVLRSRDQTQAGHDVRPDGGSLCTEVIVEEVEVQECDSRKPDTNYSRSRVAVSPQRRRRPQDADCSLLANYTGNNTTMEMDITESSVVSTPDRSYTETVRSIRGRRSYRALGELAVRHRTRKPDTPVQSAAPARPTGAVVGRKRKPDEPEVAVEAAEDTSGSDVTGSVEAKRMRLLDRVVRMVRRPTAPIVGINSDLPLSAPAAPAPGKVPAADDKRCVIV